jgi:hypothetical protein
VVNFGLALYEVANERCSYCKEWYAKPVSYHHTDEECDLNVNEHSADAAE